MYLNFVEVDDFLAHCAQAGKLKINADISNTQGEPSGKMGIATVSYYAALSCRQGDYIATASQVLITSNSLELSSANVREEVRQELLTRFEEFLQSLRDRNFIVERGIWSLEPPFHISSR